MARHFRNGAQAAHFLGHIFLKTYHLRQARPQLCPLCVAEIMRIQAAWSVCLLTSCASHGVRLLDRCACGRPIQWRRPAIDFCECGLRLTAEHQGAAPADPRELAISSQIEYLLAPDHCHVKTRLAAGLPSGFDNLSVDTFIRLIWIFGIIEDFQIDDHPKSANRGLSTLEASAVVCRAYDRLVSMISNRIPTGPLRIPIKPRKIKTQQATASALRSGFFSIEGIDMRFPLEFMLWLEDNQAWVDELRSHREATANRRQDTYVALRLRDAYYSELDWTEPLLDAPLVLGLWLRNNSARVDRLREYSRIEWKKRQPTEFMEHLLTAYNTERLSKQPFSVLFQRQMLRDKKRKTTWAEKCWEASLQRQAKYRATAARPHEPSQCSQKGDTSSSEQ